MGKQEEIWAESEGDAWFARNIWQLGEDAAQDPVVKAVIKHLPSRECNFVWEFGCANGWRLAAIYQQVNDKGWAYPTYIGVDPSMGALANGQAKFKNISFYRGTTVAFPEGFIGCVGVLIYGFCLYVCDPEDHFEIAAQGHNLLDDNGIIVIHDFDPEYPHSVPNHHVQGMMTYKMDWSQLWLRHPSYKLIEKQSFPDGTAVWVLKKDMGNAFPEQTISVQDRDKIGPSTVEGGA